MTVEDFANKGGVQPVRQKFHTCSCGCEGRDPQHANVIRREVRHVVYIEAVKVPVLSERGYEMTIIATGEYTADGERFACGWAVCRSSEEPTRSWWNFGWVRIDDATRQASLGRAA
jgi:hypothetical protein